MSFLIGHGVVIIFSLPMVSLLYCNGVIRLYIVESNIVVVIIHVNEKAINDSRQRKFSQPVNQNKHGRKSCLKTSRANSQRAQVKDGF